jgi:uncharacterized protein
MPIHRIRRSTFTGLLLFTLSRVGIAQSVPEIPQIRVTGRATISVPPERADVDVGVVTEATEAREAARRNAEKLDAVKQAVLAAVGRDTKLETVQYSLQPVYRRSPEPGNEPTVSGYTATNVLRVKELAIDSVGSVIDAATRSGANTVSNIGFGLRNEDEAKLRALGAAAVDAREKAEALAHALGVQTGRILSVLEGEPDVVRPMPAFRAQMSIAPAEPQTAIGPNAIEFHASVTLVVEIMPRDARP